MGSKRISQAPDDWCSTPRLQGLGTLVPLWVSHHYSHHLGQVSSLFVTFSYLQTPPGDLGGLSKMVGKACMCATQSTVPIIISSGSAHRPRGASFKLSHVRSKQNPEKFSTSPQDTQTTKFEMGLKSSVSNPTLQALSHFACHPSLLTMLVCLPCPQLDGHGAH